MGLAIAALVSPGLVMDDAHLSFTLDEARLATRGHYEVADRQEIPAQVAAASSTVSS
jgi:hypothetical protein